jgi:conjugative transfer signal peptidase TraF
MRFVLMIVTAAVLLIGDASVPHAPWLLYNRTPSMPTGFYLYWGRHAHRGDIVAFALPPAAQEYARRRGETTQLLLLKHVLAVGGDFVSTLNGELSVNGLLIGPIAAVDSAGRRLPQWIAARRLDADELLVGSAALRSFDSRYFGPIPVDQVIGVYRPLTPDFFRANRSADASSNDDPFAFVLPFSQRIGSPAGRGGRRCKLWINGRTLNSIYGKIKGGCQPRCEGIEPQGFTADSLLNSLYRNALSTNNARSYCYQPIIQGANP